MNHLWRVGEKQKLFVCGYDNPSYTRVLAWYPEEEGTLEQLIVVVAKKMGLQDQLLEGNEEKDGSSSAADEATFRGAQLYLVEHNGMHLIDDIEVIEAKDKVALKTRQMPQIMAVPPGVYPPSVMYPHGGSMVGSTMVAPSHIHIRGGATAASAGALSVTDSNDEFQNHPPASASSPPHRSQNKKSNSARHKKKQKAASSPATTATTASRSVTSSGKKRLPQSVAGLMDFNAPPSARKKNFSKSKKQQEQQQQDAADNEDTEEEKEEEDETEEDTPTDDDEEEEEESQKQPQPQIMVSNSAADLVKARKRKPPPVTLLDEITETKPATKRRKATTKKTATAVVTKTFFKNTSQSSCSSSSSSSSTSSGSGGVADALAAELLPDDDEDGVDDEEEDPYPIGKKFFAEDEAYKNYEFPLLIKRTPAEDSSLKPNQRLINWIGYTEEKIMDVSELLPYTVEREKFFHKVVVPQLKKNGADGAEYSSSEDDESDSEESGSDDDDDEDITLFSLDKEYFYESKGVEYPCKIVQICPKAKGKVKIKFDGYNNRPCTVKTSDLLKATKRRKRVYQARLAITENERLAEKAGRQKKQQRKSNNTTTATVASATLKKRNSTTKNTRSSTGTTAAAQSKAASSTVSVSSSVATTKRSNNSRSSARNATSSTNQSARRKSPPPSKRNTGSDTPAPPQVQIKQEQNEDGDEELYHPLTNKDNLPINSQCCKHAAGSVYRQEQEGRLLYMANDNDTPSAVADKFKLPVKKILYDNQQIYPALKRDSRYKAHTPIIVPLTWKGKKVALEKAATPSSPPPKNPQKKATAASKSTPKKKQNTRKAKSSFSIPNNPLYEPATEICDLPTILDYSATSMIKAGTTVVQKNYKRMLYFSEADERPSTIAKKFGLPVEKILYDNQREWGKALTKYNKLLPGTPIVLPLLWDGSPVPTDPLH